MWWNLVGTALLNGRNPTTYLEAIKQLRDAEDVGRMDWACFATGVKMAETAEGWGHRYKLIDTVAMELEKGIVEDNGMSRGISM